MTTLPQAQAPAGLRAAVDSLREAGTAARLLCPVVVKADRDTSAATCKDRRLSLSPDSLYSAVPGAAASNRTFVREVVELEVVQHAALADDDADDSDSYSDAALHRALSPATRERLLLLAHVARREAAVIVEGLRARPAASLTPEEREAMPHLTAAGGAGR